MNKEQQEEYLVKNWECKYDELKEFKEKHGKQTMLPEGALRN